jgi:CBS domain-containing protein
VIYDTNNASLKSILSISIENAFPDIFKRPPLFANENMRLMQAASFFAIGPQIYVDGLLVVRNEKGGEVKIMGRISSKYIIQSILHAGYSKYLGIKLHQIMDKNTPFIETNSLLDVALCIFQKTRFALIPVTRGGAAVIATLTIRDFLPLIVKAHIEASIKMVSSPLVSVTRDTNMREVLDIMITRNIRNIGIVDHCKGSKEDRKDSNLQLIGIISDRNILEFLLSTKGKETMAEKSSMELQDIDIVNAFDVSAKLRLVHPDVGISKAAEVLMNLSNPYIVLERENMIVTPWDIVMKTFDPAL